MYFWPFVYLFWRSAYSNPLPILNPVICMLLLSFRNSLYIFKIVKSDIRYLIIRYFLPFSELSFYKVNHVFCALEFLIFVK